MRRATVPGLLLIVGLVVAGCSHPAAPAPAVTQPSESARMVCEAEAQEDLTAALGVAPLTPPTSTWADGVFTCRYSYPSSAVLVLAVTELADAAGTDAYLAALRSRVASPHDIPGLGEAAFTVADGSTYVRKDFKVLRVDVTGLPDPFGHPARNRVATALTVASVIMSCWTGE